VHIIFTFSNIIKDNALTVGVVLEMLDYICKVGGKIDPFHLKV
jgi:hypothetical protein